MSKKAKGYERTDRVSQKLQEILARLLLTEVRDPRVQGLEITDAEVSPDLHQAQIYWVRIQESTDAELKRAAEGLEQAKGYLKRELGKRLDTKYTPDLDFRYDETLERARRIENLLEDVDAGEADEESDGSDEEA